jgi:putative DNA primase/helicase
MVLKRPIDYCADQGAVFEIHFEKARGLYGDDVAPVEARLSDTTGVLTWDWRSVEGTTFDRVVDLSKEGLSQKEIADELQLNKSTVSRHIKRAKNEGYLS